MSSISFLGTKLNFLSNSSCMYESADVSSQIALVQVFTCQTVKSTRNGGGARDLDFQPLGITR